MVSLNPDIRVSREVIIDIVSVGTFVWGLKTNSVLPPDFDNTTEFKCSLQMNLSARQIVDWKWYLKYHYLKGLFGGVVWPLC